MSNPELAPPAALLAALAGRYRLVRELGAGGMAVVWLADDLRHGRRVAIKALREPVATAVGAERFLKEIAVTAALQHPHIVPLFDSGSADGVLYYVMPLVDGETLRARLTREAQLPTDQAARIAREVAEGLEYAHRHGVIHRDIKPENILLHDGHALVADFGIALALEGAGAERITGTGLSIGTPQYMSPEQAAGERHLDARSDVFSLGAVTYEMLAGTPPHTAPSPRATLARLLTEAPTPLAVLRPGVPATLAAAVARALAKTPADRFPSAGAFAQALGSSDAATVTAPRGRRDRRLWLGAALAAAAVVIAALALVVHARGSSPALRPGRMVHLTRERGLELDPALSPDGRSIAYVAGPPGDMRLYVRQIAGGEAIEVAASLHRNQRWPSWSPDGTRLVFQAGDAEAGAEDTLAVPNALYVVPALGGTPRRVFADPSSDISPQWSPDGTQIVFARGHGVESSGLWVIDANGGRPPRRIVASEQATLPRWSPDGRMVAFNRGNPRFVLGTSHLGNNAPSSVWVVTLADGRLHRITAGTSLDVSPVWAADGRTLLFVSDRDGARDIYRVSLTRDGDPSGTPVRVTTGLDASTIDLARDGRTLTYAAYTNYSHIWSVALPAGERATTLDGARQITVADETVEGIALSPDGRWLAYDSDRSGNGDIWKISTDGGTPVQLTTDPAGDYVQDWSSDGREIAFHSFRTGRRQIFVMAADGTGQRQVVDVPMQAANPDFSPDANTIAFDVFGSGADGLMLTTRAHRDAPFGPARRLTKRGSDAQWSPDGRRIAYVADGIRLLSPRTGEDRPLMPHTTGKNGLDPRFAYWMPDGRSLLVKAYDAHERSSIWRTPVGGGRAQLVLRFDHAHPSARREIATDGKQLYFTIADQQSDVWLLTLLPR